MTKAMPIIELKQQIAELQAAISLPQTNLPEGVQATFAGGSLGLYEQIQARLAQADTAAQAARVQGELQAELLELQSQLSKAEAAAQQQADKAELAKLKQQMDELLDQVEPLAKQLEAVFEQLLPLDARARQLFEATKTDGYSNWSSTVAAYRRYLPALIRGERGAQVTSRAH